MAQNPTEWQAPFEPAAWSLANKILLGAGGAITLLVSAIGMLVVMGFNSQTELINRSHREHQEEIKCFKDDIAKRFIDSEKREMAVTLELKRVVSRLDRDEILLMMDHTERMKALERIQKIIGKNE